MDAAPGDGTAGGDQGLARHLSAEDPLVFVIGLSPRNTFTSMALQVEELDEGIEGLGHVLILAGRLSEKGRHLSPCCQLAPGQ